MQLMKSMWEVACEGANEKENDKYEIEVMG